MAELSQHCQGPKGSTDTDLTLAWVNGYRAAKGQDELSELPENRLPPEGQERSQTCPITIACRFLQTGSSTALRLDSTVPVKLPDFVQRTIARLDAEVQ